MTTMTSNRPYLLQAFYDWIVDNDCTPYLVVDAYVEGVTVPQTYVADGQIVLNIAPRAVTAFHMDRQWISFNTRFGGVPTDIHVPVEAVVGIYARENGQGMVFQAEPRDPKPPGGGKPKPQKPPGADAPVPIKRGAKRPSLKVIK
jgi:stringent starvation protein B